MKYKLLSFFIFCFFTQNISGQSVSISPSSGEQNTTFAVTVTGTGTTWSSSHCVRFSDGVSTFGFIGTASTASIITGSLTIPAGANVSANYDMVVYNDINGACSGPSDGTCMNCFEVTPAPVVSISPSSGEQNSSFGVTITGTGTTWSSSHCVEFSDGVSTFSFVGTASSATTITGTLSIPSGANVSANYDITVYNDINGACSGPSDGTCTNCFEVEMPPATVSISPSSGEQNSSFGVTITGVGTTWSSNHCVEFSDGVSTFSFVGTASSATTITGTLSIPAGANISANYDMVVYDATNGACSGPSDGTCMDCFEVEMAPVVSISPSSGEQNTTFAVTITGTGTTWSSSHCVEFSDGVSTFGFIGTASSASTITGSLTIPAGANVSANYDITVYDDINGVCNGSSDGTCTDCFEVVMPPPMISITPSSGEQNSSFAVTVTGTGTTWSGNHCVEFSDGISNFSFVGTASSATTIMGTLSIPAGANVSANYDMVVYNATNGACSGPSDGTCMDCFEVTPIPTVSISPSSGDPNTTFGVTVTGVGTTWSSSHCVEISDGVSTFSFVGTASSATTITGSLNIPFGANIGTGYDITVYDAINGACSGPSDGTCMDCFEVKTPASTVSISPSSGSQNSTFSVTITGTGTTWSSSHCVEFSDGVSTFSFVGTATAASTITGSLTIPPGANISADYDIAVYNTPNGSCSGPLDGLCTDCFEVTALLPLELISFTADALDAKAKLRWKIASPQNVEGYEVHRGVEDQQTGNLKWEIIDFVTHSDSKFVYDYVDKTPADGINYYRLKIVDWDESFEWSPIASVTFEKREDNLIDFFPNPMNPSETFFMSVKTKTSTNIELTIFSQSGQIINLLNWTSENQQQLYPIDLGMIPDGYYFARIKVGEEVTMRTFIVASD